MLSWFTSSPTNATNAATIPKPPTPPAFKLSKVDPRSLVKELTGKFAGFNGKNVLEQAERAYTTKDVALVEKAILENVRKWARKPIIQELWGRQSLKNLSERAERCYDSEEICRIDQFFKAARATPPVPVLLEFQTKVLRPITFQVTTPKPQVITPPAHPIVPVIATHPTLTPFVEDLFVGIDFSPKILHVATLGGTNTFKCASVCYEHTTGQFCNKFIRDKLDQCDDAIGRGYKRPVVIEMFDFIVRHRKWFDGDDPVGGNPGAKERFRQMMKTKLVFLAQEGSSQTFFTRHYWMLFFEPFPIPVPEDAVVLVL